MLKKIAQTAFYSTKAAKPNQSQYNKIVGKQTIPGNGAPRTMGKTVAEVYNPIIFNAKHEHYVIKGKERAVGIWLATVSASIFGMVVLGGYTRLTKSGLSMVRWEPHRILPPATQEQWEAEFEEYKKSPEYIHVNSKTGMDVNGFKYIFFWEWAHRILGRSIGFTFFVPMVYFWARGYLMGRLKFTLLSLFALGGVQGAIGWWMVKSGLVDKNKTGEVDKTPRVSPYRLSVHAGFAYALYATTLWQTMNVLKRPQEAICNTFEKVGAINNYRTKLRRFGFTLFPLVLLTGFFTAGTCAGISCNTFPKVGDKWFYNSNHFFRSDDVNAPAWWRNFTENKLICQVNHRTAASVMTLWATAVGIGCLKVKTLPVGARASMIFLMASLWAQLFVGVNVIWNSVPVWLASTHQIGAMTVLSALMFALHSGRRVDVRHIKNLLGKMKLEDRANYERFMAHHGRKLNQSGQELEANIIKNAKLMQDKASK